MIQPESCGRTRVCQFALRLAAAFAAMSSTISGSAYGAVALLSFSVDQSSSEPSATLIVAKGDRIFKNGFQDACHEDFDDDGLADCVETNTGVFVSSSNTGTNPRDPDTDSDGLLDGEEVFGSQGGLNLPAMGTNPLHKDILLQYDWFEDSYECAQHSHQPTTAIVDAIHSFFAGGPVSNPDGTTGINVIQDYGQGGVFTGGGHRVVDPANPNGVIVGTVSEAQYQGYELNNFPQNRHGYFHYVLMAHRYITGSNSNSSGSAKYFGYEMMVTLNCYAGTSVGALYIRNSIVHELGHNLGLYHGGDTVCNFKPNYNSVMNYKYQLNGIDTNCDRYSEFTSDLAFSSGDRRTLDENNLNENIGVCTSPIVPINWNTDAFISSGVVYDVNSEYGEYMDEVAECSGTNTVLRDYNDWANLQPAYVAPIGAQMFGTRVSSIVPTCAPVPPLH